MIAAGSAVRGRLPRWLGDRAGIVSEIEALLSGKRGTALAERGLATVLFTDIVGSTQRAAELGDRRWRHVLEAHGTMVRAALRSHRGREVKTFGDGFLVTFDAPASAVRCARAICDDARVLGLVVRSGVHTGECELMGDDIGGLSVHIAARVTALAGPAEVLVSRTVTELVAGSGLDFESRGARQLTGVPGSWELFAATDAGPPGARGGLRAISTARVRPRPRASPRTCRSRVSPAGTKQ